MHGDRFVDAHDGIRIAVRDHGGDGRDLVLLHGAGTHLLSVFNVARKLEGGFRVVSMDARWSGQSGDSPTYSWDDLVHDVEAVVDGLGLDDPVVVGHSWGGMIAAHYGAAHPDAPAVVNLDGHGSGDASLYDGVTAEEYERFRVLLAETNEASVASVNEGDETWLAAAKDEFRAMTSVMGVPPTMVEEWTDRTFVDLGHGRWRRHPSPPLFEGLRGDLDLFSLYRRVECPLQIFNCTADAPGLPPEMAPFMSAYRRGLSRALRDLAEERPNVDIVELPDFHHNGVLARGAGPAVDAIRRFVAAVA
ncbi:MAG TPA: alpha/beta hydrolase [Acidimicrobiales bacterium]|nr:alpha/beta hydrolase [Acidimicrobiales bacterium]